MNAIIKGFIPMGVLCLLFIIPAYCSKPSKSPLSDRFSLGVRTTFSIFDHEGGGIGTGGQFRVQLTDRVNTEWFADYIVMHGDPGVRNIYYHIGWSVMYYPWIKPDKLALLQPYVSAGHCFDYNKKTLVSNTSISADRWGSAIQSGLGMQLNLSQKFNVSLGSLYMIHLTKSVTLVDETDHNHVHEHNHILQGHWLNTISLNIKPF